MWKLYRNVRKSYFYTTMFCRFVLSLSARQFGIVGLFVCEKAVSGKFCSQSEAPSTTLKHAFCTSTLPHSLYTKIEHCDEINQMQRVLQSSSFCISLSTGFQVSSSSFQLNDQVDAELRGNTYFSLRRVTFVGKWDKLLRCEAVDLTLICHGSALD